MKYQYTCPSCGRTFILAYKSYRVTCRNCGTSWNMQDSKGISMEVIGVIGGLMLAQLIPVVGGIVVFCAAASIFDKKRK